MNKQREALQVALQALEEIAAHYPADWEFDICVYAKNLLCEALAEPEPWTPDDMAYRPGGLSMSAEQEPVAWRFWRANKVMWCYITHVTDLSVNPDFQPLYTYPPSRKPLTDEHISAIVQSMSAYTWDAHMLARLIEKAHGIGE